MGENLPINTEGVKPPSDGASAKFDAGTKTAKENTLKPIEDTDRSKPKRSFFDYIKIGFRAYWASLALLIIIVPVFASVITFGLYFSPPLPIFTQSPPNWYPVVFGILITNIIWWVVAALISYIATAEGANTRSYSLLTTRLQQLKARLKEIDSLNSSGKSMQLADYQLVALREVRDNLADLETFLYKFPVGLQWVLGFGYINAWGKLHRAEEALIEVEPVEMAIRGALHDKLAIQESNLSSRKELLNKLRQAVKELYPAMESRFKTYQPHEDNEEIHKLKISVKQIAAKVGIDLDDDLSDITPGHQVISAEAEARARLTLREVRRTLNEFRDRLWEGLLRARNELGLTIFVVGFVTHILLVIFLLSNIPSKNEYLAAAIFYMVGAVAGLLERMYRESQISTAIDDYGLSLARLVATPLLSGLAGIGGVLLISTILPGTNQLSISNIFALDRPDYIIAAAISGLAPNRIIRSLQERSEKYISALQSSKGAETVIQ